MRAYYFIPAVPALALLLMPLLPFLNSTGLWFGLPRLLVWGLVWVALLTPSMLIAERMMSRTETEK
jgi:hypothetical protein